MRIHPFGYTAVKTLSEIYPGQVPDPHIHSMYYITVTQRGL